MKDNIQASSSRESQEYLESARLIIDALKDSPEHIKKISDELQKVLVSAQENGNSELVENYQSLLDRIDKNKAGV